MEVLYFGKMGWTGARAQQKVETVFLLSEIADPHYKRGHFCGSGSSCGFLCCPHFGYYAHLILKYYSSGDSVLHPCVPAKSPFCGCVAPWLVCAASRAGLILEIISHNQLSCLSGAGVGKLHCMGHQILDVSVELILLTMPLSHCMYDEAFAG